MSKVFRLFISSTFSDFSREREVLQQYVFPRIDEYCESNGYTFQAIDLRWGVSEEAQLDQKTLELCLNEVKVCKFYPHPNFLIMSGNRYGWIPLPYLIEATEFESVLNVVNSPTDIALLKQWYVLDANQLPASYVLQERSPPYDSSLEWSKLEAKIQGLLYGALEKLSLTEQQANKYFLSATEHEVNEGVFNYLNYTENQESLLGLDSSILELDKKYVYAFLRSINPCSTLENNFFFDESQVEVEKFRDKIRRSLDDKNILNLKTNCIERSRLDEAYLGTFGTKIFNFLKQSIDDQIQEMHKASLLEEELERQKLHLNNKLHMFSGRSTDLAIVSKYLNNNDTHPLIIYGKSGLGKSSFMAKMVDDTSKCISTKVVYRFVGVSPESGNTKDLWSSILLELGKPLEVVDDQTFEQFSLSVFKQIIEIKGFTVIFIDAVDQLVNLDSFSWLPESLPKNIKIVLSALSDEYYPQDSRAFEILSKISKNIYQLTEFETDEPFLLQLLKEHQRMLQPEQSRYVLSRFEQVQTPLYMKIAEQELIHWRSYDFLSQESQNNQGIVRSLEETQQGIITQFIKNLDKVYHHNPDLVEKVMGYIYSSTVGLSEKELIAILSMDETLLLQVAPQIFHKHNNQQLPIVIWARLKFQIFPFLSLKKVDGVETMHFFHREFNDAIRRMFDVKAIHQTLISHIFDRLRSDQADFNVNRFGRLFSSLILSYAFVYDKASLGKNVAMPLDHFDDNWMSAYVNLFKASVSEYFKSGRVKEAQDIYRTLYENKKLYFYIKGKDKFLYVSAKVEQSLSNIEKAKLLFEEALSCAKDNDLQLSIKIEIAKSLRKGGDANAAQKVLRELLEKDLHTDSIVKADALIQMGLCYLALKNNEAAYHHYKQADDYLLTTQNIELKLYNWLGISTVVAFMGRVEEGLDILLRVKHEAKQYGYQNFYIDSLNGIAKKYLMLGKHREAIKNAQHALELGEKQGNKILVFLLWGYLLEGYAGLYKASVNLEEQKENERKAMEMVRNIESYKNQAIVKEKLILSLVDECIAVWKEACLNTSS